MRSACVQDTQQCQLGFELGFALGFVLCFDCQQQRFTRMPIRNADVIVPSGQSMRSRVDVKAFLSLFSDGITGEMGGSVVEMCGGWKGKRAAV